MPDIEVPGWLVSGLQVLFAFFSAFGVALWLSLIVWAFRDAKARSRDAFAIMLGTLMVAIFGPLGLILYYLLRPQVTLAELYERSLEEEALLQDLEEKARCSGCSRVVEGHWIVCPDCHTQLKRTCQKCNEKLNLRWNICPNCATPVNQAGAMAAQANHAAPQRQPAVAATPAAQTTAPQRPVPAEAATEPIQCRPTTRPPRPDSAANVKNPTVE